MCFVVLQAPGTIPVGFPSSVWKRASAYFSVLPNHARKLIPHPIACCLLSLQVEDGSVDLGILGENIKLPLRFISSTDTSSIDDLLRKMGQRLGSMLQAAQVPNQRVMLHSVFTRRDGTSFSVDTPLGTTEDAQQMLSTVSLWQLVPEQAQHEHIKHVSMSIQVNNQSISCPRMHGNEMLRCDLILTLCIFISCRSPAHKAFRRSGRHPHQGLQPVSRFLHSRPGELFLENL